MRATAVVRGRLNAPGTRGALTGPILLLAAAGAVALGQHAFAERNLSGGAIWCVIGIAMAAVASGLFPRRPEERLQGRAPRLTRPEVLFLVAVTVAAGALRFVALDHLPPGAFFDEAQNVLVAGDILKGRSSVYIADFTQMPALFFYLVAGAVGVFGKSIVTIRCLSALLGTLTVPAFYMLARRLFPGGAAAAATILLAGSRWHLTFSRVGFTGILDPLLEILAVLALMRAIGGGRRRDYIAFGVAVGVGLQTYYAFNLFPAVLAVAAAAILWGGSKPEAPPDPRGVVRGLVWSALAVAVLLAPLAVYAAGHFQAFIERSATVAIWNPDHHLSFPRALWDNCRAHLLMFNFRGDANPRHNLPDHPLLTAIEGVLLVLGTGFALGRGTRWPQAFLLAWLAVMLLPGILTIEAPQAYRTIGALPAVFLLIAQAFQALTGAAANWGSGPPRGWLLGLSFAALALAAAAQNTLTYFEFQVRNCDAWTAFDASNTAVAQAVAAAPPGYTIWVDPVFYHQPVLDVVLGDNVRYNRFLLGEHVPLPRAPGAGKSPGDFFVLEGFEKDMLPLFRSVFPHAQIRQHLDPCGDVLFVSVAVPYDPGESAPGSRFAGRGYLGAFYDNENWVGKQPVIRHDPAVFFHFHWEGDGLPGPFTADWAAHLTIPTSGEYGFDLLASGPACVLLDGKVVVAQSRIENEDLLHGAARLEAGEHTLVVRYHHQGFYSTVRFWWQPPGVLHPTVIPLAGLTPMGQAEYLRLKDTLPVPPPPERDPDSAR
jgi:4-amino-4-deoxy-L-arabinose transferase-like glycosyltransferase